jgi:hypothetical protein
MKNNKLDVIKGEVEKSMCERCGKNKKTKEKHECPCPGYFHGEGIYVYYCNCCDDCTIRCNL